LATSCTIGAIAIDDVQCANHPETRFMMGKYQRGPTTWHNHTIVYFRRFLRFKNHTAWPSHALDTVHLKWLASMFLHGFERASAEGPTALLPMMRHLLTRLNRIHAAWHHMHAAPPQPTTSHQRTMRPLPVLLPRTTAVAPPADHGLSPISSDLDDETLLEDSGSFTDEVDILAGDLPASLGASLAGSSGHGSTHSASSTTSTWPSTRLEPTQPSTSTLKSATLGDPFDWDFLSGLTGRPQTTTLSRDVPTLMIPSASGSGPTMSAREAALQRQLEQATERAYRAEMALNARRLRDDHDAAARHRQRVHDQAAMTASATFSTEPHTASAAPSATTTTADRTTPPTDSTSMDPFARFLEAQTRALEQIANKREVSVQGMSLPQFYVKENESVEMFIWQARQFFEAKNFDLADAHVQARCVTTIIANFRGNASF